MKTANLAILLNNREFVPDGVVTNPLGLNSWPELYEPVVCLMSPETTHPENVSQK